MEITEFTEKEDALMERIEIVIKATGKTVTCKELMGIRLWDWRFWIGDVPLYLHELKNFVEDIEAESVFALKRKDKLPPAVPQPVMPGLGLVKLEPLMTTGGIPRRIRLDLNTPAELAILAAVSEVEKVGAHPLLTEAVTLLSKARSKVADYVEHGTKPPHEAPITR